MKQPMREILRRLLGDGETDRTKITNIVYEIDSDSSERYKISAKANFATLLKRFRNEGNKVVVRQNFIELVQPFNGDNVK